MKKIFLHHKIAKVVLDPNEYMSKFLINLGFPNTNFSVYLVFICY